MSIRLEVQRAVWDALASAVSSSPGPSPQRILVAVSGGLDSMVLLSAAREVAASHGLALSAIHVNHHLRATAAADAAWVRHYCTVHDIPLRIAHVHLDEVPPVERRGPEADARRLRYQAVAEEARRIGAAAVLLAHHADDQVETVLLRLMRGTSVTGLHGMLPHTEHHGVVWLRPLLLFTKQQLAEYARQERIDYVEDDSNLDERYTRNYLRHRVVPLLRARQPRLAETVGQMCQILRDEDDYLEAAAREAADCVAERMGDGYCLDVSAFAALHRSLQRRVIKIILYCLTSGVTWTFLDVHRVLSIAVGARTSAEVVISGGVRARREYNRLWLLAEPPANAAFHVLWQPAENPRLVVHTGMGDWEFDWEWLPQLTSVRTRSMYELYIPEVPQMVIRSVRTGDRMRPLGVNGTKKVHDIFIDAKVPRALRSAWPLFEVEGKLLWIPGLARGAHCLVTDAKSGAGWIRARPSVRNVHGFADVTYE